MQTFNKLPNYTRLKYYLNSITGWYYQTENSDPGFNLLPAELKTAPAMQPFLRQQGAKEIIKGRQKDHKQFFTGLRSTEFENLFTGDNRADRPSLILFDFSKDKTCLRVIYINGCKVFPKRLKTLIADFKRLLDE